MTLVVLFAQNLRNARARRHLSQAGLAAKAGISVSYISMLERGQRSPLLDTIDRLAEALAVSPLSLLERTGETRERRARR